MKIKTSKINKLIVNRLFWFFVMYNIGTYTSIASNSGLTNTIISPKSSLFAVSFTTNPAAVSGTVTICQGQTITYTNTSTGVGTNPTFAWSFPGGSTTSSTSAGPHTIAYNTTGDRKSVV